MTFQPAEDGDPGRRYQRFIQNLAREMRSNDKPPRSLDEWESQRRALRGKLLESWSGFPDEACPLEPQLLGILEREGYRVEKVVFQTRPGVQMTANAYVPKGAGPFPAVLCVHGHWRGAKQDPVVQSRAIGLAKLGFFALTVDAFGAGERAIGKALGEYHGEMTASTLWPAGLALSGLQVYENMRAVDYLQSRPEVDGTRIGVTGASGGGNQSMYVGAFDERIAAVVPVCSVGTYQAYLTAAACMCEIVPRALTYTEEWGVLALVAPRALLIISASDDAFQFSPGEAAKSVAAAKPVFELYGKPESIQHAVFESKHDYNRPMREAMYGWMTLHLKGQGGGTPIPEPEFQTEDPEILRCFPGDSRPDGFITLPMFAAQESRKILARRNLPAHVQQWEAEELWMLRSLAEKTLGGFPERSPVRFEARSGQRDGALELESEPGVVLSVRLRNGTAGRQAIVIHPEGMVAEESRVVSDLLSNRGWGVLQVELRNTGNAATPNDTIGSAVDHTSAQWGLWCGRPLLGQWVWDVSRAVDALEAMRAPLRTLTVVGMGSAGLIAICAAALDRRIGQVLAVRMPASLVSDRPYKSLRVGVLAPGMLRDAGDVAHLAALLAPRRLIIAGGVTAAGEVLDAASLKREFRYTQRVYELENAAERIALTEPSMDEPLIRFLESDR